MRQLLRCGKSIEMMFTPPGDSFWDPPCLGKPGLLSEDRQFFGHFGLDTGAPSQTTKVDLGLTLEDLPIENDHLLAYFPSHVDLLIWGLPARHEGTPSSLGG